MGNKHINKIKGMYCSLFLVPTASYFLQVQLCLTDSVEFNFHNIPEEIELPSSDRDSLNQAI